MVATKTVLSLHRPLVLTTLLTTTRKSTILLLSTSTAKPTQQLAPNSAELAHYIKHLDSCIRSKSYAQAKNIHQQILASNANTATYITDPLLLEKLVVLYSQCNETEHARELFDKIPQPNVFLWNAMIRSYSWNGPFDRAVALFRRMVSRGVAPNKFTFPFVLKACSALLSLEDGVEIHDRARRAGLESDVFVATALIDMYMKCGRLDEPRRVFSTMERRDVVAWNAMIAGFSLHGLYEEVTRFLLAMQRDCIDPNASTVVAVLPVVGQHKALRRGKSIHCFCVRRHIDRDDVLVCTALLDMYAKCELLGYAQRTFDSMGFRNEVTWSAMIGGYVLCDEIAKGLELFEQMVVDGASNMGSTSLACALRACARSGNSGRGRWIHCYSVKFGFLTDTTVGNSLLSMYSRVGSIEDALQFFDEMRTRDTVSYSAVISGCVQNGNATEAFSVFRKMQFAGVEPDVATMVGILPACSHLAALQHGKCSHGSVIVRGFASDVSVCNSLIDMYAKCGRIELAREVFDRMAEPDTVSWNTIIAGYGIHGLGTDAVSLFRTMEDSGSSVPDGITFVSLISACSHSGLVAEGKHWFGAMTRKYNVVPRVEHYICMVDLLGRGGLLEEARGIIRNMPLEPDVRVWGALLGACRVHKNIEMGEEVSRIIQSAGPEGTGSFVLLSNMYNAAGRFDEAARVRVVQREQGFRKSPGCSWVEIGGVVHAFVGGDGSHPESSSIYEKLENLSVEIRRLGYRADTSFVLHDVDEEEKERALLYHSEKLAIAFGILSLGRDVPILVTKNLRVCGDCHAAIKFITLAEKRAITVRDASRFHHFKDGECNCGDFW
ncbi:pentatricopeptide repeat-containing protein [Iris pallida]|uniref:Pentatricopeptide repeat-containing protein n=1 Tax=Iris pallida TaxID=29817 RepID=A0AAX6FKA3_IRIPA|nr:pentatricopeptide repeat-containing protein [Iris pallida]